MLHTSTCYFMNTKFSNKKNSELKLRGQKISYLVMFILMFLYRKGTNRQTKHHYFKETFSEFFEILR
jgi:hypothetical protein